MNRNEVQLAAANEDLRGQLARANKRIEVLEKLWRDVRAKNTEYLGLLQRWRARGFPMGASDLWDDTLAILGATESEGTGEKA